MTGLKIAMFNYVRQRNLDLFSLKFSYETIRTNSSVPLNKEGGGGGVGCSATPVTIKLF